MKSYNPILFDLDGTLTDPGEGIRNSVAHALRYYGIQMSTAELNRFIGPPLAEGFQKFCGFSVGQAAEAVEHYREYYREKGMLENRVYDGIPALLDHLRGAGKVLAVATSKPEVFARQILHHYGLDGNFQVIAGPCSVESKEQIIEVAKDVKASGATLLRGGAFKPRTSPYAFQGLRAEGIELLEEAKKETGMPIVTEIMNAAHLPLFENVDIIQVGARNMQNFELLKILGKQEKPVLLKRGLANTIEEWLMSAEYIMAGGNKNVILCERGIRTFETATRNTLDLSAIAVLKEKTHLPVIVDPSHATGVVQYVERLSIAAVAAGADGLIIEVHNNPKKALCDGPQSLTPAQFDNTMKKIKKMHKFMSEEMAD